MYLVITAIKFWNSFSVELVGTKIYLFLMWHLTNLWGDCTTELSVAAGTWALSFRRTFLFCVTMPIRSTNSRTFCPDLWFIIWEGLVSLLWITGKVQKSLHMQKLDCATVTSVKHTMSVLYREEQRKGDKQKNL